MTEKTGIYWDADVTMTSAAEDVRDVASIVKPYNESILDLTIFVSCYNEADFIVNTLDTTCAAARSVGVSFEIIVIDDGSKDNSRDLVREYIASHPEERIILRANRTNKGFSQNYLDAAFLGKGKYYRLICGDSPETEENTASILSHIGEADCIVPYYPMTKGRSLERSILSRFYVFLVNALSGNRLRHYNGLAVHLRHNVMRWHTNTKGFGFQAEILCLLLDAGFTYKEVPVNMPSAAWERQDMRSGSVNVRNLLSVAHTMIEILMRRVSTKVYRRR